VVLLDEEVVAGVGHHRPDVGGSAAHMKHREGRERATLRLTAGRPLIRLCLGFVFSHYL
jgi:hypothetical protein